jgi:hypothetical protein
LIEWQLKVKMGGFSHLRCGILDWMVVKIQKSELLALSGRQFLIE